ncbi:MAG: hypothetical protein AAF608_06255 [Pseudomonadota bacterium]
MLSLLVSMMLAAQPVPTATLDVTYQDVPDAARADFEAAANVWEHCLFSDAPIRIHVRWMSGGPTGFAYHASVRNKRYLPRRNAWYPTALASALRGRRVTEADDMNIFFRDKDNWHHSGDDPIAEEDVDFINVAVHEIAHGLGISSGSFIPWQGERIAQIGYPNEFLDYFEWTFELPELDGTPLIYDTMLRLGDGRRVTDFSNPSTDLARALDNPTIHFAGKAAIAANDGFPVGVTPGNISHIPANGRGPTPIMLGDSGQGESVRQPDPILLGMLEDIGWTIAESCKASARAAQAQ